MTALPALTSFWLGFIFFFFFLDSGEENSATALPLPVVLQNPRSDSFLIGENKRENFLCFMECGKEQGQPYRVKNEES